MECPKCHTVLSDNETVCPKCHKVLLLECPNCHSLEDTAVCSKCGYKILVKCSKCGRINPAINDLCVKCGFSTKTSLALQECESDEIAYVIIKFTNLKKIRRILKSQDLYTKFFFKLKNLLLSQIKNVEGLFITYGETFVVNFNKELSFPTSANKAVRFALKLTNAFTQLNLNVIEEMRIPLGLNITIARKTAEDLQTLYTYENNVKLLNIKKDVKKYLKGTQITLDQYVWDEINKEYKTDSLYSVEENGRTVMFYEIIMDSYVLPPDSQAVDKEISANKCELPVSDNAAAEQEQDIYSFKVFDINAKCSFDASSSVSLPDKLAAVDFGKTKIIAVRADREYQADINEIAAVIADKGYRTITVACTEAGNYEPWGFFIKLFKSFYGLSYLSDDNLPQINPQHAQVFEPLFDLCKGNVILSSSPEDARFAYIDLWIKFLSVLGKTTIIVDGFENLDDTSIQTLELYYDNFKNIKPNFVFITSEKVSLHSRIKRLLRAEAYTEIKLEKSSFSNCLSTIKLDASDFIGSFYYEKIKENFKGSYLYFKYAMKYLIESGVLINFENKLLVKDSKSAVLPTDLSGVYKSRMKQLGQSRDISLMVAYLSLIYPVLDIQTLGKFGVNDIENNAKKLFDTELAHQEGNNIVLNNYFIFKEILSSALKKPAEEMLAKNILEKAGAYLDKTTTVVILGKLGRYAEEYSILCQNSDFALACGDYDAYLKNCLGFLSLIESTESDISQESIEENKIKIYNNILKYLYNYAPTKIYFIEDILLADSIKGNDNAKVIKLSNLMLQGALISSNYSNAPAFLHNILSRMENPTMITDGVVNTRFLLLSLINIEILYNSGKFRECVNTAEEILSVVTAENADKIRPAGFSTNSFISHIIDTMRIAAFAKLYLMDGELEQFLDLVKTTLNADIPERDCILAIKDFMEGKVYETGAIENYSPLSKAIFLILQELAVLSARQDYERFAQNIFQAKLLAEDISQTEVKYFCDLLIGYAYEKAGIRVKAEFIYKDVLDAANSASMFNIKMLAKYLLARQEDDYKQSLLTVNDALDILQRNGNQSIIFYVLFEKLYIEIVKQHNINGIDADAEEQKIMPYAESLKIITG